MDYISSKTGWLDRYTPFIKMLALPGKMDFVDYARKCKRGAYNALMCGDYREILCHIKEDRPKETHRHCVWLASRLYRLVKKMRETGEDLPIKPYKIKDRHIWAWRIDGGWYLLA